MHELRAQFNGEQVILDDPFDALVNFHVDEAPLHVVIQYTNGHGNGWNDNRGIVIMINVIGKLWFE